MEADLDPARVTMLRTEIGDDLVMELCRQYLDELRAVLAEWRSRVASGSSGGADAPTHGDIARVAHRLAGSGGSLGFARLRTLMLELEHHQPASDPLGIADVDTLDSACLAAQAAFDATGGSAP